MTSRPLLDALRAAFTENLLLKALSLGSAIALFAVTHGSEVAQRKVSVSVVSTMPQPTAKRALMTALPTEVTVTLHGPRSLMEALHASEVGPLDIDLSSGQDAKIDLDESMFHIPAGLTADQIDPPSITVKWDDVITKSVPVQVPTGGEPPRGYAVRGVITSEPAEVRATGPKSLLDVIQVARAAPFDVTGLLQGPHTQKLPLERAPAFVTYDVEQITATVDVTRELVSKTLTRLKVEVIGLPRATTRPSTVNVIVTGSAEELNAISADAVVPRVEPKAAGDDLAKPGSDNLPVLVDLPKSLTTTIEPARVVVTW